MLVLIHFRNPGSTIPTPSLILLPDLPKDLRSKRQLKGSRDGRSSPEPQQSKSPIPQEIRYPNSTQGFRFLELPIRETEESQFRTSPLQNYGVRAHPSKNSGI